MATQTTSSWSESLRQTLTRLQPPDRSARIAIVGVGNELQGDDSAGIRAVHTLRYVMGARKLLLIIDAGPAPESCTGTLRVYQPELVLFIDSAEMGGEPGRIKWLDWHDAGSSVGTHGFPLSLLARFLEDELDCTIGIVGIQPEQTEFDSPLSPSVRSAVAEVVQGLTTILCEPQFLSH